jgi:hypothetical protein
MHDGANTKSKAIDADLDDLFDDELSAMTRAAPASLLRSRRKKEQDHKMRSSMVNFRATNRFGPSAMLKNPQPKILEGGI